MDADARSQSRQERAVARVNERQFLGHRLVLNGTLTIAPNSLKRAKNRIGQITRRNRASSSHHNSNQLGLQRNNWF